MNVNERSHVPPVSNLSLMDTPTRPGNGRVLMLNANFPTSSTLETATYLDLNTNIGNGYIAYSILKILGIGPGDLTICNNIWRPLPDKRAIIEASERCDWIFFNFQDQLRTVFPDEEYETALETLRTLHPAAKMVAFSLSANTVDEPDLVKALSPARRRFFDYLAQRCISIGVRGPYTAEILAQLQITNVGVVGCPSYFEHGPGRIVQTPEQRAGLQCLGTTGSFQSAAFRDKHHYAQGDWEWPFIRLMHAPEPLWREENGAAALDNPYDIARIRAAASRRFHFFTDFVAWQRHIREHCRLVCGTRLHGAIMALNAGVPAIVTNGDARARDACEFLGIPHKPGFYAENPTADAFSEAADPARLNGLYGARWNGFAAWLHGLGLEPRCRSVKYPVPIIARAPEDVVTDRALDAVITRTDISEAARHNLARRLAAAEAAGAQLSEGYDQLSERYNQLAATCNDLAKRLGVTEAELGASKAALATLHASTSWRITSPLRRVKSRYMKKL